MMLNSDLLFTLRDIPGIKDAAPYLLYRIFDRNYNCNISLGGIDTSSFATTTNVCAPSSLVEGKYLSGIKGGVVAEESFAMALKLNVGDTLSTFGSRFLIEGIVNSGIRPGKADLYAPIDDVRIILKDSLNCIAEGFDMNIVAVEVEDARIQSRIIARLRQQISYLSVSSYNCFQPASDVMNIMKGTSALISLVVFIFLIMFSAKTQSTNLMERYREMGILKSLGWSDTRLSFQILTLSLFQALAGSLMGIGFGIAAVQILNGKGLEIFGPVEFMIQPGTIPVLIVLSLAGGLIASFLPVIKLYTTRAGDMINSFN